MAKNVRQWKDTLVAMERGEPMPWPLFVDFIRLRRTGASDCTCGMFQVMSVCEEIQLWLILKELQVQLMYSWRYLVLRPYMFSMVSRGVMEPWELRRKGVGGAEVSQVTRNCLGLAWQWGST